MTPANWKRAAKKWRRIAMNTQKFRDRDREALRRAGITIGLNRRVTLELAPQEETP